MRIKITKESLLIFLFWLYVFSSILLSQSIIGKLILLVFCGATITISFLSKRINFSVYSILEIIFLCYCLWQFFSDITALPDISKDGNYTILYNAIFTIAVFNFILLIDDFPLVVKYYANAVVWASIALIPFDISAVLAGRLAATTKIIGGITFGGQSATVLAMNYAIAMFFLMLTWWNINNKLVIRYSCILVTLMLLTGTRKVLLLLPIIFILAPYIMKPSKNIIKAIKLLIQVFIFSIIAYLILTKIPTLYEKIGIRIENAVVYFLSGEVDEGSIYARSKYINLALDYYKKRPYYGWGINYFKYGANSKDFLYSHNNFTEILVSSGLVGFIIYYVKYIYLFIILIKNRISSPKELSGKYTLLIIFFVCMIILEYWQIVYIYRFITIAHIFILSYCKLYSTTKQTIRFNV